MRKTIHFGQSLLSGIGFIWLFLEAYYGLAAPTVPKITFGIFLALGLTIGIIWFFVDGFFITGFLKQSIKITSNAIDVSITVGFGDLFRQDGCKAIPVNDFFDSVVDEKHVAKNSLHGLMLTQFWAGNTSDWDNQVTRELANTAPIESVATRPTPGKHNRYPVGTTISAIAQDNIFLCVALSKTDVTTLEASATYQELQLAVHSLLGMARTVCSGRPVNLPLMGSGLARTGVKPNIIVDLLLLAIFEESRTRKITTHIRIILPKAMRDRIDLTTIQKDWK